MSGIHQPYIPSPSVLWRSFAVWMWGLWAAAIVAAVPHRLVQLWFNQSLGFQSIFWTNIRVELALFFIYGIGLAVAVSFPIGRNAKSPTLRNAGPRVGLWVGTLGGWILARQYQVYLLALNGVPFGTQDPVFEYDIGFYVFTLPALELSLAAVEILLLVGLMAALIARYDELQWSESPRNESWKRRISMYATSPVRRIFYSLGTVISADVYLSRFELLFRNNEPSGVRVGAEYIDVAGVVSTLNQIQLATIVTLGLTLVGGSMLRRMERTRGRRSPRLAPPLAVGACLVGFQAVFGVALIVKDNLLVRPNEPIIQQEYIQRHIDGTIAGFRLGDVEVHEWVPPDEPLSPEALLQSETVRNAPFLPAWSSSLEAPPDAHHYERLETVESGFVFGPMLQIYDQEQQLRPYYDFLSVDAVRYTVEGKKQMFASAVRELPSLALVGEKEWLKYWGSAALLYTHGMGLVMSPVNRVDEIGSPLYVSQDVPPRISDSAFTHEPRIYFGEGARDDYVLTNVRGLEEFDYATAQAREEFTFPSDLRAGIPLDSWFKRLVLAAYTKDVTAFLFSRYIEPGETRVHIHRTPISRISHLAPFLFLDTNAYAFIGDGSVQWMVNGLTTSSRYPYAYREVLGDKSDERGVETFPQRKINYAEDSVKATIDALSGEVNLYRVTDDPIVRTWEAIYPDLFDPTETMPEAVRAQLTYPLQWFHIQFDDIYKRYHQENPIEFYNLEDLWDDADETLGSIGRGLTGFGTADQMTFSYEGYDLLLDPADLPTGVDVGEAGDLQFAKLMPFTPEAARNLRSLIIVLQDPENYGRLLSLQVPQGVFVPGPEQIDAYIDNDRPVHQQVTMWIRHAAEVMRGNTLLLPVGGDLMYLETVWVNSIQNELPQLKLFAVRYHDRITSGPTLEEAIRRREWFGGTSDVQVELAD